MTILCVRHRTEYQYRQPVSLGEHRLMSRPRDSHDLRLLDTALLVSPQPSELRWMHDVFGNSIVVTSFADNYTFGVAPDAPTVSCGGGAFVPFAGPNPPWLYCANCGDAFHFPGESLIEKAA